MYTFDFVFDADHKNSRNIRMILWRYNHLYCGFFRKKELVKYPFFIASKITQNQLSSHEYK